MLIFLFYLIIQERFHAIRLRLIERHWSFQSYLKIPIWQYMIIRPLIRICMKSLYILIYSISYILYCFRQCKYKCAFFLFRTVYTVKSWQKEHHWVSSHSWIYLPMWLVYRLAYRIDSPVFLSDLSNTFPHLALRERGSTTNDLILTYNEVGCGCKSPRSC